MSTASESNDLPVRLKRRHLAPLAASLCVLVAGPLAVSSGAAEGVEQSAGVHVTSFSSLPAATRVVHVSPVDSHGRLLTSFHVRKTVRDADCGPLTASVGPRQRPDPSERVAYPAFRCSAGVVLYEPCWRETGRARPSAVCMDSPWQHYVTRLLTAVEMPAVPPEHDFSFPWGVQLANGQRCFVLTGAHDSLSGKLGGPDTDVIDYDCGHQPGLVLLRGFDRSAPLWRVRTAVYSKGYKSARRAPTEAVLIAWY